MNVVAGFTAIGVKIARMFCKQGRNYLFSAQCIENRINSKPRFDDMTPVEESGKSLALTSGWMQAMDYNQACMGCKVSQSSANRIQSKPGNYAKLGVRWNFRLFA